MELHKTLLDSTGLHGTLGDSEGLRITRTLQEFSRSKGLYETPRDSLRLHRNMEDSAGLHRTPWDFLVFCGTLQWWLHQTPRDSEGLVVPWPLSNFTRLCMTPGESEGFGISGTVWDSMRLCGTLWNSAGLCSFLQDSSGLWGTQNCSDSKGLCWTLRDSLRLHFPSFYSSSNLYFRLIFGDHYQLTYLRRKVSKNLLTNKGEKSIP